MDVVVIGLGRFGSSVAVEFAKNGHTVLGIDSDPLRCREVSDYIDNVMILDSTDTKALKEAGVHHFDIAIIGMGEANFAASLLTASAVSEIGVSRIVAKASSKAHERILRSIGVDQVFKPEFDMGIRVAKKIMSSSVLDFIDISSEIRMDGITVSEECKVLANRTIKDIDLRKNFGVSIICIKRESEVIIVDENTIILENDVLLVIGENTCVDKFEKSVGLKGK